MTPTPSNPQKTSNKADEAKRQADARARADAPYLRAANEDDDGYDPYSDRPAAPEPLFERDPWS